MIFRTSKSTSAVAGLMFVTVLLGLACASRYRLDLYMTLDEARRHMKVESTQYVLDAVIGSPYAEDKVEVGDGSVAVATFGTRVKPAEKNKWRALSFDEYFRCQVYVQVGPIPEPDSSNLVSHSLLYVIGRYERPIEQRSFLPREGYYSIDSVTSTTIYLTIDGAYTNQAGEELLVDGQFSVEYDR